MRVQYKATPEAVARESGTHGDVMASDDAEAVAVASRLVLIGYEPVLIGPLAMGKYLMPERTAGEHTPDDPLIAATLKKAGTVRERIRTICGLWDARCSSFRLRWEYGVPDIVHNRGLQPAFGSSIRPSTNFMKPSGYGTRRRRLPSTTASKIHRRSLAVGTLPGRGCCDDPDVVLYALPCSFNP